MSAHLHPEFRDLIKMFNAHGVEYLLVGAHALAMHGIGRNTADVDFWVNPTPANSARVVCALEEFGFVGVGLKADDFAHENRMLSLGRAPLRIEILTSISGVSFAEAWGSRAALRDGNLTVHTIGLEAMLKNKRASGRDKDKPDIRLLEQALLKNRGQAQDH